jgi:hypothetical protein
MAHEDHVSGACLFLLPNVLEGSFEMILENEINDHITAHYTAAWNEAQRYTGLYRDGAEMSEQETAARLNALEETIQALRLQLAAAHEHVGALVAACERIAQEAERDCIHECEWSEGEHMAHAALSPARAWLRS